MLKDGVLNPERLVDITRLPLRGISPARRRARRRRADDDGGARGRPGARRAGRRSCARRCSRAPRRSCATWRRSAATCCSARAAATSAIRRCPRATSERPGAGARRSTASGANARDPRRERTLHRAARLGSAVCRWSRSTPSCTRRGTDGERTHPVDRVLPSAGRSTRPRERPRPRRADHRDRDPAASRRRTLAAT